MQEQIAELLDVKSFKRKYAEMTRRIVEVRTRSDYGSEQSIEQVPEKDFLQATHESFTRTIGEHRE